MKVIVPELPNHINTGFLAFFFWKKKHTHTHTQQFTHLLDKGSNVLLNVELLQRLGGAVNSILLHVLRHVSVLDHSLAVRHGWFVCVFCLGEKDEMERTRNRNTKQTRDEKRAELTEQRD